MEKDDELLGEGNSYNTEFRQYDPRVGRWLSLDPLMADYPDSSPYVSFNNNPILYNDPYGLEGENTIDPPKTHNIKSGETLSGIAEKHKTTVDNLAKWNDIVDPDKIKAGDKLYLSDPTQYNKSRNMTAAEYYGIKDGTDITIELDENFNEKSVTSEGIEYKKEQIRVILFAEGAVGLAGARSLKGTSLTKNKKYNPNVSATKRVMNSKGLAYPKVVVEGFGEVPFPKGPFTPNNSQVLRSQFTPKLKNDFKNWWIQQGRPWPNVPEGSTLNIHHIKPLGHGGTNSFDNLVPLIQPQQHQPFTNWWRGF